MLLDGIDFLPQAPDKLLQSVVRFFKPGLSLRLVMEQGLLGLPFGIRDLLLETGDFVLETLNKKMHCVMILACVPRFPLHSDELTQRAYLSLNMIYACIIRSPLRYRWSISQRSYRLLETVELCP